MIFKCIQCERDITALRFHSAIAVMSGNRMMQVWGGQNVYFPMGMVWKVSQRDREIFREFNGRNHHELARKFGVSLQWVYSVVKRVRKEELDRMQGKLFADEPDVDTEKKE